MVTRNTLDCDQWRRQDSVQGGARNLQKII